MAATPPPWSLASDVVLLLVRELTQPHTHGGFVNSFLYDQARKVKPIFSTDIKKKHVHCRSPIMELAPEASFL